jgi:hypothetical protein
MGTPSAADAAPPSDDPLPEALALARGAGEASLGLKLLGGLAVRVLCPDFPPRLRAGQDIDFACVSKERKKVAEWLAGAGCEPDRRFNNLNGDRQMYFNAPSGRPVDVMVNQLTMCHTLDFRSGFSRQQYTIDAVDVLLSKLQIVELNEKDAHDIVHLLAGLPVSGGERRTGAGAERGGGESGARGRGEQSGGGQASIDTDRFAKLLGADWGWWRTVTGSLEKLPDLVADRPGLVPPGAPYDPLAQARKLLDLAQQTPKSIKWKLRAATGDRVRWYELPEEVDH